MPPALDGIVKPDAGTSLNGSAINIDCVGCWLFNEGTGLIAYDISPEANHGVLSTGDTQVPTWSTNADGKPCLEFDPGDTSFVYVDDWGLVAPDTEMTYMIRQYADTATVQNSFCTANDTGGIINALLPWAGGTCYWDAGDTSSKRISYNPALPVAGAWQTWILTASATGTFSRMYRNGDLEHSGSVTPGFDSSANPLYIGSAINQNYFGGKIDFLRVWSRVLSDAEISDITATPFMGIG